jgi:hypothetical protein
VNSGISVRHGWMNVSAGGRQQILLFIQSKDQERGESNQVTGISWSQKKPKHCRY